MPSALARPPFRQRGVGAAEVLGLMGWAGFATGWQPDCMPLSACILVCLVFYSYR